MTGTLEAGMLGGFRLSYDGKNLDAFNARSSQFASLMQLVLHYPEGARPQDLQDALFGSRRGGVEDAAHALRSIVYNANLKLSSCGVPGRPNVIQKKGVCAWAGTVPIEDDSRRFEKDVSEAMASGDLSKMETACMSYAGEFLAGCAKAAWAVSEAKRYRDMFTECAKTACTAMETGHQYERALALSVHAAAVCPFDGWEQVSVRMLNALGRHSDARELHEAARKKYFREQGVRLAPCPEPMENPGSRWDWADMGLSEILAQLDGLEHGRVIDYMSFRDAYAILSDLSWRTGMSLCLMSCLIRDRKGNQLLPGPVMDRVTAKLGAAIAASVRASDAACCCGGGKYLILLPDIVEEDCELVRRRICGRFYGNGRSMRLEFDSVTAPGKMPPGREAGTEWR